MLRKKQISGAIQVFQLNVELHPNSPDAYDSLGEAYADKGDKDLAIRNYEKSVELDPKYNHAAEMLKKLTQN